MGWILLGFSLFLGLGVVSNTVPVLGDFSPLIKLDLWALIFGTLIFSVCLVTFAPLEHPLLRRCGELSYSIYLLHPALMAILIKLQLVNWISSRFTSE